MKISRSTVHKVGYGVQWCAIPLQPVLGCSGVTIAIAVEKKKEFLCRSISICLNYSLRDSGLTDTGAIALAEALLQNKSLEILK